jgi:hypothetical protein
MKTRLGTRIAAVVLALAAVVAAGTAAAGAEDVTKMPGYVDFSSLNVFGKQGADVEIFLTKDLLAMVSAFSKTSDPDFADMLSKLVQIRVQTYAISADKLDAIEKKTDEMSKKLEQQGWVTMIKVLDRQESGQTYVYSKLVDGKMQGLLVMNVDPKDDASFINIVGEIDPEQLGKIQGKFNIHGLDSLEIKVRSHDDDAKKNDKK